MKVEKAIEYLKHECRALKGMLDERSAKEIPFNPFEDEYEIKIMAIEALEKQIKRESLDCGGLKPCPFCGGQAHGQPEGDYWEMTCEDCGCAKQGRDHDSARNEWNRRSP